MRYWAVRLAVLVVAFCAAVAGCGGSSGGQTGGGSSGGQSGGEVLVAAQHPQCGTTGTKLLHYLTTGDNGGDPSLDQRYGSSVNSSAPQARAIADKAIQDCDNLLNSQALNSAAATSSAAAATSQQRAAAAVEPVKIASCKAIGGTYPSADRQCDAPNTSGYCAFADVNFDSTGRVSQSDFAQKKAARPGCWPQ